MKRYRPTLIVYLIFGIPLVLIAIKLFISIEIGAGIFFGATGAIILAVGFRPMVTDNVFSDDNSTNPKLVGETNNIWEIEDDSLKITDSKGITLIPFRQIIMCTNKEPRGMQMGTLTIKTPEKANAGLVIGGIIATYGGEYVIVYRDSDKSIAERIHKIIVSAQSPGTIINASISDADEIKKYRELLDSGIITKEEFDAKKKQLLNL